jgi:hypothetical protein
VTHMPRLDGCCNLYSSPSIKPAAYEPDKSG